MNVKKKSKTSLMLMEIIITIALFMVCGAFCIRFFVNAHVMSKDASDKSSAVICAESVISVIKCYDDSMKGLEESFVGTKINDNTFVINYDESFKETKENAAYKLTVTLSDEDKGCTSIDIRIDTEAGKEIYSLATKKAINY